MKLSRVAVVSAVVFLLATASAFAVGHPTGIKVTVTSVNTASFQVDFDVTVYTDVPYTATPTGVLGDYFATPFFSGSFVGTWLNPPPLPAIDYGDGSPTVARTTIPPAGPGVYRGSFSHVYPGPGNYPLRAGTMGAFGPAGASPVTTGNPFTVVGSFSYIGHLTTGSLIFTPNYSTPSGFVFGASNYPNSNQPYPTTSGSGFLVIPAGGGGGISDIPTMSFGGLLFLGLLLSAAALYFLRR